ncbi:hypothetical protein B2I00_09935, partial [Morganella morganii]|uniref:hypothetical protein n=1 Tax=Morganella morganii TaxID=582 RepID=UPI0009F04675
TALISNAVVIEPKFTSIPTTDVGITLKKRQISKDTINGKIKCNHRSGLDSDVAPFSFKLATWFFIKQ